MSVDLWVVEEDCRGNRLIAKPVVLEFEKVDEYSPAEPTMKFQRIADMDKFLKEFVKAIIDEGHCDDGQGETKALKYHLEDMRKLVFNNKRGEEE